MVTSSAVVGSSRIMKVGLADQRGSDQDALLHAAAELMRVRMRTKLVLAAAGQLQRMSRRRVPSRPHGDSP